MSDENIILFDGVCNLCSSLVRFIIRRDYKNKFKFCPLQTNAGKKLIKQTGINPFPDTIVLICKNKYYFRSTAIFKIIKELKGWIRLFYPFIIIPAFIRNFVYNIIAKYRYSWFGKKDKCMVPTAEIMQKFIE